LATPKKISDIAEMKARIESSEIAIATKYVGISVEQVTELRKQLREAGVEYKVYKNTLARRALKELDVEAAADFMEGPTAWAFSADPVAPAKILKAFSKKAKTIAMVGGVLGGKPVNADQLTTLASLPSHEQLLSQIAGTIAAPIQKLMGTINAVPSNLANVIDQVQKMKADEENAA
tara:strand:+ start:508 stop:1038 length:531 start_codon:yes stop_codon:yes gene_type:complete